MKPAFGAFSLPGIPLHPQAARASHPSHVPKHTGQIPPCPCEARAVRKERQTPSPLTSACALLAVCHSKAAEIPKPHPGGGITHIQAQPHHRRHAFPPDRFQKAPGHGGYLPAQPLHSTPKATQEEGSIAHSYKLRQGSINLSLRRSQRSGCPTHRGLLPCWSHGWLGHRLLCARLPPAAAHPPRSPLTLRGCSRSWPGCRAPAPASPAPSSSGSVETPPPGTFPALPAVSSPCLHPAAGAAGRKSHPTYLSSLPRSAPNPESKH